MKKSIRIILICIIFAVFYTGCRTFKAPEGLENQPDECKDFYYVLEYYSVQGGDSAFVGTVYEKCIQARKEQKSEKVLNCHKLYQDVEEFKKCIK